MPEANLICAICGQARESPIGKNGKPRIPRGWKIIQDRPHCPKCKLEKYALRAVVIPVAKCDWDAVMPILRGAWLQAARCSNWLLTQYYQRDNIAGSSDPKLPKREEIPYLYPEARARFPEIEPTVLVSVINAVSAKYTASRFDVWRGAASLPVYRDLPLPVPSQNWQLSHDEAKNERVFSSRINGTRHEFRLRRDHEFARQHRVLDRIAAGDIEAGEAAIYQRGKSLLVKIAAWLPRTEKAAAETVVKARTCADGFLVAVDGQALWRLNADHVVRWIVGAAKQQQRLREDLKAERRFPKQMREAITARMGELKEFRANQLSSWMHEASMQLVNWAKRRHASRLVWDDSYPSMLPKFPWFTFGARLQSKCETAGIEFVHASEGATLQTQEPLAKEIELEK
jgi:hypothetical protein